MKRLNTELAKKPAEYIENVVMHELSHIISPRHDAQFIALLDQHLPHWRTTGKNINTDLLRNQEWQ